MILVAIGLFSPNIAAANTNTRRVPPTDVREEAVDRIQENRVELRDRISQISDERKRNIVENLAERFNNVNEKWTTHWNNVLTRLSEILVKIDARSDEIDTTSAEAVVARAQGAVNTQAAKVYKVEFDDEAELREQIQALISEFKGDLRSTKAAVSEAREAVQQVFRQLKALGGNDEQ